MLKRLSTKKKKKDNPNAGSVNKNEKGAAVPYKEPDTGENDENDDLVVWPTGTRVASLAVSRSGSISSGASSQSSSEGQQLLDATVRADLDAIKQHLKNANCVNFVDEKGNTPLIKAAFLGHSRIVRYLLMKGADIEACNRKRQNALYVALEKGHTGSVGVLLDFMHSVDTRPREPFVLLRAKSESRDEYLVEKATLCRQLKGFASRDIEELQLFVAHGQRAEEMSVFFYSVLDVPVTHAFIMNSGGELNMKNFQRFEAKTKTQSLTILNTCVRIMDATGYANLKSLILVSCGLIKFSFEGLDNLELMDVRHNCLTSLPENIQNCKNLKTLRCSNNAFKRLPRELGKLSKNLISLDCSYNQLRRLPSYIVRCTNLRILQCDHNDLTELPIDIGLLTELEDLHVNNNKLSALPLSVSALLQLKRISFHSNPLQNIPVDFPEEADGVRQYLKSLQDDPVPNNAIKLVLVGQEGVGKTTFLKALKRHLWVIPRTPNTPKTEGIDVKEIQLDDVTLRCFDCGGDVDFNETHNFFITQGALYLTCFNLAEYTMSTVERNSFLLGRLQLWLQYIFTKVPNAQVVILGTHADHSSLKKHVFEQIWEQLRTLLVSAREHHRQYFHSKGDRLGDCLLCQADSRCLRKSSDGGSAGFVNLGNSDTASLEEETSFNESASQTVTFPHIVGYYEISSIKAVGNNNIFNVTSNQSIEQVKDCIKELAGRLTKSNPEIPRQWANVRESLHSQLETRKDDCVCTMDEMAKIALAQGITSKTEMINMLHFLKAQGHVLFFPNSEELKDLVILDPEWLAKIFSSVVSFRETGISNEGFIEREKLKSVWAHAKPEIQDKILNLLRYFGLCLPLQETNLELFPCRLPLGEPDEVVWPASTHRGQKQLSYSVTFPSMIPPPFFSDLIVMVYRHRFKMAAMEDYTRYFSNQIVDCLRLREGGCKDCGVMNEQLKQEEDQQHKVHFELIPHKRTIVATVRGKFPCCMMRRCSRLLNKVASKFEGLGTIDMDAIVCAGCQMQKKKTPYKFSAKHLRELKSKEKFTCTAGHNHASPKAILTGTVHESCLPLGTIRPKSKMDSSDYSGCPKLFIVLPVNKDGLSFDKEFKLFVSSLMFDGFAAHLLCEFPDGYHVTRTPGYRLRKPKEFMQRHGNHVIACLRLLCCMAASSVVSGPHTKAIINKIDDLVKDITHKFPGIKDVPPGQTGEQLISQINATGAAITREELRNCLQMLDKPDTFGPLRRLKYGDQLVWLCNEHYKQLRMLTIGTDIVDSNA